MKSPTEQPAKQRRVLSPALLHVERHAQKRPLSSELVLRERGAGTAVLVEVLFWLQDTEVGLDCVFWLE